MQLPQPWSVSNGRNTVEGLLSATAICNPVGKKIPWISWRGVRRWKMLCPREMESRPDSYINLILRQVSFPALTAYFLGRRMNDVSYCCDRRRVADSVSPPTARQCIDFQRGFPADWITLLSNKERVCDLKTSVEEELDCEDEERERGITEEERRRSATSPVAIVKAHDFVKCK